MLLLGWTLHGFSRLLKTLRFYDYDISYSGLSFILSARVAIVSIIASACQGVGCLLEVGRYIYSRIILAVVNRDASIDIYPLTDDRTSLDLASLLRLLYPLQPDPQREAYY